MDYTSKLYKFAPTPAELTAKQRRRVRDLFAYTYATGDKVGGLVAKHVAAEVICYATGYDSDSRRVVIDSRALSDYDVANHPLVNFSAILKTRGYRRAEGYTPGRPQKWIKFIRVDTDDGKRKRDEVTICNISSSVYITGKHSRGVFELLRGYARQVDCKCYENYSEIIDEAVA